MSDINDRSELENYTYNKYAKSNDFNANRRFMMTTDFIFSDPSNSSLEIADLSHDLIIQSKNNNIILVTDSSHDIILWGNVKIKESLEVNTSLFKEDALFAKNVTISGDLTVNGNIIDRGTIWSDASCSHNNWNSATYGNGLFVAIAYNSSNTMYSSDGKNWLNASCSQNNWNSVTYGNGLFVAIAYNSSNTMYSSDGKNWLNASCSQNNWISVTYGNGLFVVIPYFSSTSMYSSDGINWLDASCSDNNWQSVTYGNGLFVAIAYDSSTTMYSSDGINWSNTDCSQNAWNSVTYGNGIFVAVNYNNSTTMYSPDGINWLNASCSQNYWSSVTYGNGLFVAVASGSSTTMYSPDGINWLDGSCSQNNWKSVTYGNGLFVAVASGDSTMYSPDGINWLDANCSQNDWKSITYGNGLFIVVAYNSLNSMYSGKMETKIIPTTNSNGENQFNGNNLFTGKITLQTVSATDVSLANIDISQNLTVLQNTILQGRLDAVDASLTNLDVSQNVHIVGQFTVINNTFLQTVSATDVSLTNLDISQNLIVHGDVFFTDLSLNSSDGILFVTIDTTTKQLYYGPVDSNTIIQSVAGALTGSIDNYLLTQVITISDELIVLNGKTTLQTLEATDVSFANLDILENLVVSGTNISDSLNIIDISINSINTYVTDVVDNSINLLSAHVTDVVDNSINLLNTYVTNIVDNSINLLNTYVTDVVDVSINLFNTYVTNVVDNSINLLNTYVTDVVDNSINLLNTYVTDVVDISINLLNTYVTDVVDNSINLLNTYVTDVVDNSINLLNTYVTDVVDNSINLLNTHVTNVVDNSINSINTYVTNVVDNSINNLLTSNFDASFSNVDVIGDLTVSGTTTLGSSVKCGVGTTVLGTNSAAFGNNTTSSGNNSFVCGKYNESDSDKIFIIGGGTNSNNLKNLITVDYSGNMDICGSTNIIGHTQLSDVSCNNLKIVVSAVLPFETSIGDVDSTELGYLEGVSSLIQPQINSKASIVNPTFSGTIGGITKETVGLENVENTTDLQKVVSTATSTALNFKANIASPTFTGTVTTSDITCNGDIGIGTSAPGAGLDSRSGIRAYGTEGQIQTGTYPNGNPAYSDCSIYSQNAIRTLSLYYTSDRRIKQNITELDDNEALEKLRLLKPCSYYYKENARQNIGKVTGFIAQEVAEVLPNAVSLNSETIPNIQCEAYVELQENGTYKLTLTTPPENQLYTEGILTLRHPNHQHIIVDIITVVDDLTLIVSNSDEYFKDISEVFVLGEKVNDFNYLDKSVIFTIATAAVQELDRQLQTLETTIASQDSTITDLSNNVNLLQQENASMKTALNELLAAAGKPTI